jgi:hypothetical protein
MLAVQEQTYGLTSFTKISQNWKVGNQVYLGQIVHVSQRMQPTQVQQKASQIVLYPLHHLDLFHTRIIILTILMKEGTGDR